MKNKYGVKITDAERKYFNSLKKSIRVSSKNINKLIGTKQQPTYLRKKSTTSFTPTLKKTTVHTFKTREEFLQEVEKLTTIKSELSLYKPRKPKRIEELPKRLQKSYEKSVRQFSSRGPNIKRQGRKQERLKEAKRLLRYRFVDKRNQVYRENMISAILKTFESDVALELAEALNEMTESEFLNFFLSRPEETINYVYYNPHIPDTKQLDLMKDIVNAKAKG